MVSVFRRLITKSDSQRRGSTVRRRPHRRLRAEALEDRRLLATDCFGQISGNVFNDINDNGIQDGGEAGIPGAIISLSGTDDLGQPVGPTTATTDTNGMYAFNRLRVGNYTLTQTFAPTGFEIRPGQSPAAVNVTVADGLAGQQVDSFNGTSQLATATSGTPGSDTVTDAMAIGNNRDLFVELVSPAGQADFASNRPVFPGVLFFNPSPNGSGRYIATWDGDNNVTTSDPNTLAFALNEDLTQNGQSAFRFLVGIDEPLIGPQSMLLRVYTDANHWSEALVQLPNTGGMPTEEVIVDFGELIPRGAAGPVDLTDVGAIQLDHQATGNAADGSIDQFELVEPNVFTQNFANLPTVDLQITKMVDDATPPLNSNVTFDVVVQNNGPLPATDIVVQDTLPAGATIVGFNSTPGTTFNATTGQWDVGSLPVNGFATLSITLSADQLGKQVNMAEITNVTEMDTNPDNNSAMAMFTPAAIDLQLAKSANSLMPTVGQNVNFVLTLTYNDIGSETMATGVTVLDNLPTGTSFVGFTATQGSYNSTTGIWTVGSLAPGDVAMLTITANVTGTGDTNGKITNTAQVQSANEPDVDSTPGVIAPNDDDQAMVMIMPTVPEVPSISLVKRTNGQAPNTATGGPLVNLNESVRFSYLVTNTGNVPLVNVTVTDDNGTPTNPTDDFFGTLDPSTDVGGDLVLSVAEAWTFNANQTATRTGQVINRARVTAVTQELGNPTEASGLSNHFVLGPSTLSKRRFLSSSVLRRTAF